MNRVLMLSVLIQIAASAPAALAADASQREYLQAVERRIPNDDRAQWDAYVAREGFDKLAEAYYVFGASACQRLKGGQSEQVLVRDLAQFLGKRAAAIIGAAKETICPGL